MVSSLSFLALHFKAIPAGSGALAIRDLKLARALRTDAQYAEPCEEILFAPAEAVELLVEQIIGIFKSGEDHERLAPTFFALKRNPFAQPFSLWMQVTTLGIVTVNPPIKKPRDLAAGFALEREWIDKE